MTTLPYPRGAARSIAEAREAGFRPAQVVLIVLAGRFDWPNPTVYATPGQRYRWDWLKGLHVVILIDSKTRLDGILRDILYKGPNYMGGPDQVDLIDHERRLGWTVLRVEPDLQKVQWPKGRVEDWLSDDQPWHRDLNEIKETARRQAEEQRRSEPIFEEPKGFWPWN